MIYRQTVDLEKDSPVSQTATVAEQTSFSTLEERPALQSAQLTGTYGKNSKPTSSVCDKVVSHLKDGGSTSSTKGIFDMNSLSCA